MMKSRMGQSAVLEGSRWLAVVVAILVMAAGRVESNPGAAWTTTSVVSEETFPDGDFLFDDETPQLMGGSDTAVAVGNPVYTATVDTFDDGSATYVQADDFGAMAVSNGGQQGFVRASGTHFLLNGKRFYVNGANLYYLMSYGSWNKPVVTSILQSSASAGVNVVRTWAFADGPGTYNLQMSPGVYSEQTFRGLDFTIAQAKKFGIRLILSLVNNYPDYGGRPQYVKWAKSNGNWNAQLDDFYTDSTMRQWYKNHIKRVLTRVNTITGVQYRDDPTIFSWELINEPRCESDKRGYKFQGWVREMAAYVKSVDMLHMLEVGLEGFYSPQVNPSSAYSQSANPASYAANFGVDFILNNQPSQIDFATVHSYPDSWVPNLSESGKTTWMASWVKTHINDAQYKLRKPVLFAEFGRSQWTPGFSQQTRINDLTNMFNAVYASASSGGAAAGSLIWQFLPPALQFSNQDGYGIILSENPTISTIFSKQSYRMSRLY